MLLPAAELRDWVKHLGFIGSLSEEIYLRLFRHEGEVVEISDGCLRGWKLHRFTRTVTRRHLIGEYESFLQQLILGELKSGMTFYDVGANAGFMSLVAARALGSTGRIIAFEAHPKTAKQAARQFRLNHLDNAVVVSAAVSDAPGFVEIDDGPSSDMVKLVSLESKSPRRKLKVRAITLDQAADTYGAPDLVKMDIEGAEMMALLGASETLSRFNPTLLIEIHSESLSRQVRPFLCSFGYRCYRLSGKEIADESHVRFIVARK
jgi:FkbM family methyltransferase